MNGATSFYSMAVKHPALVAAGEVVRTMALRGWTCLIVGGAVRDLILNREVRDVDLVTDMRPDDISTLFRTYEPGRSREFKTLCIVHRGHHFETSMFRGIEPERMLRLQLQEEHQKRFILFQDAAHRDFTINAMYLDEEFNLIDPHYGIEDLRAGLLRGVQDPLERFREDPLRMLRAVRLGVQLGFNLEKFTSSCIHFLAHRIPWAAPERLGGEIIKMASLSGPEFAKGIEMMEKTGLLRLLLPEVQALKDIREEADHSLRNLFEQTLAALTQNNTARPELNLALLTHALGRREINRFVPAGPVHNTGSMNFGSQLIQDMSNRLRLAKKTALSMRAVAAKHTQMKKIHQLQPSQIVDLIEDRHWHLLVSATRCIVAARGDKAAIKFDEHLSMAMDKVGHALSVVNSTGVSAKKVITGWQVMEHTGLEPGPAVGRIIRETTRWARDNRIQDEEEIISHARQLAEKISKEKGLSSSMLSGSDHGKNQS